MQRSLHETLMFKVSYAILRAHECFPSPEFLERVNKLPYKEAHAHFCNECYYFDDHWSEEHVRDLVNDMMAYIPPIMSEAHSFQE